MELKKRDFRETRKEVEEIKNLEEGVKELVIGLRMWGIYTVESCEGHLSEGSSRKPYPWVSIALSDLIRATHLLYAYSDYCYLNNIPKKVTWVIEPSISPIVRPAEIAPLKVLQEEVKKLGLFLREVSENVINSHGNFLFLEGDEE